MTEFELHQVLIHTRAEFDQPTFLLVFLSVGFITIGLWQTGRLPVFQVRMLQVLFVGITGFLWLRAYAAIVRLRKISAELRELETVFDYANPTLQIPTYFGRMSLWLLCLVVALYFLNRAINRSDVR